MDNPRVMMLSLWRNDEGRQLPDRIAQLLLKSYPELRWVWVVGDSADGTEERLRRVARTVKGIEVVKADTGIVGDEPGTRMRRLSLTASAGLDRVRPEDDYVLIHESDIISPHDLVERLLATGKCPVAGWPVLGGQSGGIFYDTWAYRKDGRKFSNEPPHHPAYRPDQLFEVDGVGTVWMFHAEDVRAGVRCEALAAVELCQKLRARGRRIWVDPTLVVVQPLDLLIPHAHPKEVAA